MAMPRPELLFVRGPQEGQRAVLMMDQAIMGRSPDSDIRLEESFASRRQVRFDMTAEGVVAENLSSAGTQINGKRYKVGKKILLDTGDVLGVGEQTAILFVAAGDDPAAALATYRKDHPSAGPKPPVRSAPAATAVEAVSESAEPETGPIPSAASEPETTERSSAQAGRQQVAKMRRYAIMLGISAVITVGLIVLAMFKTTAPDGPLLGRPTLLTHEEIKEALLWPLPELRDTEKAAAALQAAQTLYPQRFTQRGSLYEVVNHYKIYLASKDQPGIFAEKEDNDRYETASQELLTAVYEIYDNGYALEQNRNYYRAKVTFEKVLPLVPERSRDNPANAVVCNNVLDHLRLISDQLKRERKR